MRRGEEAATDAGAYWRIELPLEEAWPGGPSLVERRCAALSATAISAAAPKARRPDESLADFAHDFPQRVVFLDLETCGLAGSALFLAGLLRMVDGRLAIELLLARDYSEELAVLNSLWQRLADAAAIVTFNGKSFDWPMVVDRSRRHLLSTTPFSVGRVKSEGPPRHIDLLHPARRRWKGQAPDCKLQTLERVVCGRVRTDDMPGSQIPAAYRQFVRTGFEREMDAILRHNALDLVTMLDLAMRLAGG
jgi:uncharacterized protein YprB with RNaseH-like and TPR domain